ncbi:hypothetical protein [Streptomyces sp. NPDC058683]|uniref:hypothetical protein n=1 Tax=Streptomyces sp. NPDC058683 TaxID=3346597 RepID=UPI00366A034F
MWDYEHLPRSSDSREQALLGLDQDSALGQPLELQAGVVDVVGRDLYVHRLAHLPRPAAAPAANTAMICW